MRRLLLVRHARTRAARATAFPLDEPLDDAGRRAAGALGGALPRRREAPSSPAMRRAAALSPTELHARTGGWTVPGPDHVVAV